MKPSLLGWSIGFIPDEKEIEDLKDDGGRTTGRDFKKGELLEYSNVILPANQEAINDMIQRGIVSKSFASWKGQGSGISRADLSGISKTVDHLLEDATTSCDVTRKFLGQKLSRFYFVRIREAEVDKFKVMEAKRALKFCMRRLAAINVRLVWIREATAAEIMAKSCEVYPTSFLGQFDFDKSDEILLNVAVPFSRIAETLAHEVFHVWWSLSHHYPRTDEELEHWEVLANGFAGNISNLCFDERQSLRAVGYTVEPWK
jgi:hypothetical protein